MQTKDVVKTPEHAASVRRGSQASAAAAASAIAAHFDNAVLGAVGGLAAGSTSLAVFEYLHNHMVRQKQMDRVRERRIKQV